jgi:hypothetical protein
MSSCYVTTSSLEDDDEDGNNEGVSHSLSVKQCRAKAKKETDKSVKLAPAPGVAITGSAVIETGQASC